MNLSLVVLSEITLSRVIWLTLRRRRLCIIEIAPVVSITRPLLERLVKWLESRGAAIPLFEHAPELIDHSVLYRNTWYRNMFGRIEAWVNDRFDFRRVDFLGENEQAYRHVVCNWALRLMMPVLAMETLERRHVNGGAELICPDPVLAEACEQFLHHRLRIPVRSGVLARMSINFLLMPLVGLAILVVIARALRFNPPPPEPIFLGGDTAGFDLRDLVAWRELANNPADIMLVLRNRGEKQHIKGEWTQIRHCLPTDGFLAPVEAARALTRAWSELVALARMGKKLPSDLFFLILMLPIRRIQIRALLRRYRFSYFWSRDEYNVEHILRSQELRKAGGVSLGVTPGLLAGAIIAPMIRYLDYDYYYMNSLLLYERYYKHTWAPHMKVRVFGSLGLTPERRRRLAESRPKDFIFLAKPSDNVPQLAAHLDALAKAFPDRIIYIKTKPSMWKHAATAQLFTIVLGRNPNVTKVDDYYPYDLYSKVSYCVSDASTAAVEAIVFGLSTYVLDIGQHESLIFRDFPEICVTDPADLVARFKALDAGELIYPREKFSGLIDLSGKLISQVVKEDMMNCAQQVQVS